MSTLQKFRDAFTSFVETELKLDVPNEMKYIDDYTFSVFFVTHLAPYKDKLDDGYLKLLEFLSSHGKNVPPLNEEEKNKLKLYFEAFHELLCS